MMIGVDVVDLARFGRVLERRPALARRFFSPSELAYCAGSANYAVHLAATFAAKEAVMKAMDLTPAAAWMKRIHVERAPGGAPHARVGTEELDISISHDGPVVVAVAFRTQLGGRAP